MHGAARRTHAAPAPHLFTEHVLHGGTVVPSPTALVPHIACLTGWRGGRPHPVAAAAAGAEQRVAWQLACAAAAAGAQREVSPWRSPVCTCCGHNTTPTPGCKTHNAGSGRSTPRHLNKHDGAFWGCGCVCRRCANRFAFGSSNHRVARCVQRERSAPRVARCVECDHPRVRDGPLCLGGCSSCLCGAGGSR
jgi:hypothetical protein